MEKARAAKDTAAEKARAAKDSVAGKKQEDRTGQKAQETSEGTKVSRCE